MTARQVPPHQRGLCDWCFERLGDSCVEWNAGRGHPECALNAETLVFPEGIPPVYLTRRQWFPVDPLPPFLELLGQVAARRGLDRRELAAAIREARHG